MTRHLEVEHVTTYRYARPVRFGQHRVMFRPRTGNDIRLLDARIDVNVPSRIDWMLDTYSNSVTLVQPQQHADRAADSAAASASSTTVFAE